MAQRKLLSLVLGNVAAQAEGLKGEDLSRAQLISFAIGNPLFSLLAVRAMGPKKSGGGSVGELRSSETFAKSAAQSAAKADASAQNAAKSAEEAESAAKAVEQKLKSAK